MNKLKKYINENSCGFNVDQAQSRVKALKRLQNNGLTEKVDKDYQFEFGFVNVTEYMGTLIEVCDVEFGYSADKILFRNLNFAVNMETRIALVGANGIGKTTFLKVMLQKVKPLKGKVKHEKVLKYAY